MGAPTQTAILAEIGAVRRTLPRGTRWRLNGGSLRLLAAGEVDLFACRRGETGTLGAALPIARLGAGGALFPVDAETPAVDLIAVAAGEIEVLELDLARVSEADRRRLAPLHGQWLAAVTGREEGDPGIDDAALLAQVEDRLSARDAQAAARRAGRAAQDEVATARSVATIAAVGETSRRSMRPPAPGTDPVQAALELIGWRTGFAIVPLPTEQVALPPDEKLAWLTGASHLRMREVSLGNVDWADDGMPLLLFRRGDDAPWVAAPRTTRGWDLIEPVSGARQDMTAARLEEFRSHGVMLYRALPEDLTIKRVLRFALTGSGEDVRRAILAAALVSLLGLFTPIIAGVIVDDIIPHARVGGLTPLIAVLAAVALATATLALARAIALVRIGGRSSVQFQAGLWDRVMRLPTGFFRRYSVGDLVMRLSSVEKVRGLVSGVGVSALLSGVFSTVNLVLMLYFDWRLGLIAGTVALLAAAAIVFLTWLQLGLLRDVIERQGQVTGILLELLSGVAKLKVAAAESRAFNHWAEAFAGQRRSKYRADRLRNHMTLVAGLLPAVFTIVLFVSVGARGGIDVSSFIAFNVALGQFVLGIVLATVTVTQMLTAVPLFERLQPILQAKPETSRPTGTVEPLRGGIAVDGVSFRYHREGANVLNDVSLTVEPGEFVAVVGPSGSGKSTLVRLLLGFERPVEGTVYYDGRDLGQLDLRSVRQQLGVVLQNARLTTGTVIENIIGSRRLSTEDAMAAARMAGLTADIDGLPMGIQTYVSEGGATLSGGQRQRILIARALVRRPRILLFDEATSALDNATQAVVARSLEKLNVTRVVIAHRLSTIQNADRIYVMQAGRIVQHGTFDELMAEDGLFRALARRQIA